MDNLIAAKVVLDSKIQKELVDALEQAASDAARAQRERMRDYLRKRMGYLPQARRMMMNFLDEEEANSPIVYVKPHISKHDWDN